MLKVGARTKGFGNDVFAIQGDDNVLSIFLN
jgi:hypothetical protein